MTILLCGVLAELGAASIEALSPGEVVSSIPELSEALRSVATACPAIIVVGGATVQMVARSCRELRAIDSCRRAIIVALGGDRPEDVQNLLEAGADDFFAGALDGDQLRSRLLVARRLAADLARHRATERALRELSESLGTTLNSIGDGVITTDSHGVIVRMNPIAEKLTGWAVGEAKGASLSGILPLVNSDTRAKVENPFDHAFREGVSVALAPHTLLVRKAAAKYRSPTVAPRSSPVTVGSMAPFSSSEISPPNRRRRRPTSGFSNNSCLPIEWRRWGLSPPASLTRSTIL